MKQKRFDSMKDIKPPLPSITDVDIARRIAERIVECVNLDDYYWAADELEERITDVQEEIIRSEDPEKVFHRLCKRQRPIDCSGKREGGPYCHRGIDNHCRTVAKQFAVEELSAAIQKYKERYES